MQWNFNYTKFKSTKQRLTKGKRWPYVTLNVIVADDIL